MKASNKVLLLIVGVIILLGSVLCGLVFGSYYMLDQYKNEHPQPICNDTTNETIITCFELSHPGNYSMSSYVIYSGFVF